MEAIVTPDEMRAIDAAAPDPLDVLVDRAGAAVAREAIRMLGGAYGRRVVVIAGPGNNGADGRVAAERLRRRGVTVRVVDARMRPPIISGADLVIDAAYGTGFRDEWIAPEVGDSLVLAVDVPSGLDALTGAASDGVLRADRTITFQALKPGLLLGRGPDLAGGVTIADVGLDVSGATRHRVGRVDAGGWWPTRSADAHKWRGAVKLVAGSADMPGAAQLASAAALRSGAGIVSLLTPEQRVTARAEVVTSTAPAGAVVETALADIGRFGSLVIGPGLGRADAVLLAARQLVAEAPVPVVVDGDALFACAWSADGAGPLLAARHLPTVLTPHDGEFRHLTGRRPGPDRIAEARELAAVFESIVLLKGPTTVVAGPPVAGSSEGPVRVIDHGDDRLATPGSGDVLAGMIGAALASGGDPLDTTAAAAWLHAEAAHHGPREGLVAGDLVELLPAAITASRRAS
ncbi:MAG: NAD(P)H-hydrate dehydratase [Actinomycetota bacterium]